MRLLTFSGLVRRSGGVALSVSSFSFHVTLRQWFASPCFPFCARVAWFSSQVATKLAFEGDATPFTSTTVEAISKLLHSLGFQRSGNEVMYNGHTGRKLVAQIFIGPTYYQVCLSLPYFAFLLAAAIPRFSFVPRVCSSLVSFHPAPCLLMCGCVLLFFVAMMPCLALVFRCPVHPCVSSALEAHGRRQDPFPCPWSCYHVDSAAYGGSCAHGWPSFR